MATVGNADRHRERAEAQQRAATVASRRRRSSAALSTHLAHQPGSSDGRKIAAVDKNIEMIDKVPDSYASTKKLYLSKNSLRSLAGVEQFRELRALSVADNLLADFDCLAPLASAGIALEAASFEGNPMADLPNYRAQVIHRLGPTLAVLDNRPVSAEERAAASGAVAHEATLLALMLSNACLVHKLGRAVQLVRLHCELQCAVLSGRYGRGGATAAGGADAGVACGGRGVGRMLQQWDYEGSLGQQERDAICLAIRREVGRRHRKLAAAGRKAEDSGKLWQQALAQVMLLQQETIASLMGLLETARADAAASLAPLTRPPSPVKRAALLSEAEAQGRVRQEREALIQELRDACLCLAEAGQDSDAPSHAAQLEARVRELHAALEATGASQGSPSYCCSPRLAPAPGSDSSGRWAITAVRPTAAVTDTASAPASPRAVPLPAKHQSNSGPLKSALKRPAAASTAWTPARPSAHAAVPVARQLLRPGSARLADNRLNEDGQAPQQARSDTAPTPREALPQQQPHQREGSPPAQQAASGRRWRADNGLAEYEALPPPHEEQARCDSPRPFRLGSAGCPASGAAAAARRAASTAILQPCLTLSSRQSNAPTQQCPPAGWEPLSGGHGVPDCIALQWTPNPLAGPSKVGSPGACDSPPCEGLAVVFRLLAREGRAPQVEALKHAITEHEATAAELQANNCQLAEALQQVQARAAELEAALSAQRQATEDRLAAAEAARAQGEAQTQRQLAQLKELGAQLEEAVAARCSLQVQLAAAAAEQARLLEAEAAQRAAAATEEQRRRAAAAETEARLSGRIAQLEARKAVHLHLTVQSHEEEWRAEAARSAELEARVAELAAHMAAHQRRERLEAACAKLAARLLLRRVLRCWRKAATLSAHLSSLQWHAGAFHRHRLLREWLARWRLATQRSRLLAERQRQRQRQRVLAAWQAWRAHCRECMVQRGLQAAAGLHHEGALLRRCLEAWHGAAAAHRQMDLPAGHPAMQAAVGLRRASLLHSCFRGWRGYMSDTVLPRLAAVQLRAAACEHRLRCLVKHWRLAVQESKQERMAVMHAAFCGQRLLLRCGWRAWCQAVHDKQQRRQAKQLAEQHCRSWLLALGWSGWLGWTALCRDAQQRQAARTQASVFKAWRSAAKAAEKRRLAELFDRRRRQRRFRAALAAWRQSAAARRAQHGQLARARALLARRLLGRVVAGWRRATLAGKLYCALEAVHSLQGAVERARLEADLKAQQIESLNSVRVTVEGTSETLSLQVSSLDAELAAAQRQVAELQAAAHAAQQEHAAVAAVLQQAHAAAVAAREESDAALAARQGAEAERDAAVAGRQAAERRAEEAEGKAQSAAAAATAAAVEAIEAAAAVEELSREREALEAQLEAARAECVAITAHLEEARSERADLGGRLERAQAEAQQAAAHLAALQGERSRLLQERDHADEAMVAAVAEQQAALKQAERLAQLCEEQQQQCLSMRGQVGQLQGSLGSQAAMQAELAQLSQLKDQLTADNESMQGQLERLAAAVARAESDNSGLQRAADAAAAEQRRLQERCQMAEAQAQEVGREAGALRSAKTALEAQLEACQVAAQQAAARQHELEAQVAALAVERDSLAERAEQLGKEQAALQAQWGSKRSELEASVEQLRGQLLASNEVLESSRRMLGETCFARTATDQQTASLTELLRSVKAELLLKDASIKALTRENAQRAERLRALQAQSAALGRLRLLAKLLAAAAAERTQTDTALLLMAQACCGSFWSPWVGLGLLAGCRQECASSSFRICWTW
ncbi:hypothetical protein ABPG77_008439 [Micractinium sp. CCAP 211/92]